MIRTKKSSREQQTRTVPNLMGYCLANSRGHHFPPLLSKKVCLTRFELVLTEPQSVVLASTP